MTREEYRQHMRKYSRETMVMSFVVTKHPDFEAMQAAGKGIIQYLLEDLIDPAWHCVSCSGYGYEFVPTWREEYEEKKTYPPRGTGNTCPACRGKGNINSWACMMLLRMAAGDDSPRIENWMRGRHDPIVKVWRKWGEQNGYLPVTPEIEEEPDVLTRVGRALLSLLR